MTTGRINQITIVYREGCGHQHREGRWRVLKLLGGIHEGCAGTQHLRRTPRAPWFGNPLSHSRVPQGIRPPHRSPGGGVAWAPQEVDSALDFSHFGVRWAWLPPVALFQDLPAASHPQNPFFSASGESL
ncbi:MAG: hypothetical protein ACRERD_17585 [Candidatus Binatia bacterium]